MKTKSFTYLRQVEDLNREEVDPSQHGHMRLNEILPGHGLASFRRRRDAMPLKDVSHNLIRDRIAEVGQCAYNSVVTPGGGAAESSPVGIARTRAENPVHAPALSLQTLVENNVKRAVGLRFRGAEIRVVAFEGDGSVFVEVSDDGPGFTEHAIFPGGHGLHKLQQRVVTVCP